MQTNPHEAELRAIFKLARIDYGRIDYGIKDGQIQVWEINTNPMLLKLAMFYSPRKEIHELFAYTLGSLWETLLDTCKETPTHTYPLEYLRTLWRVLMHHLKFYLRWVLNSMQ